MNGTMAVVRCVDLVPHADHGCGRRSPRWKRLMLAALLTAGAGCRPTTDTQATAPAPPEVTISQVVQRPVIDHEDFTGRIDAVESVDIRSRVQGYLDAVHFTDGQE